MPTNDSNTEAPDEHSSERAQQGHYTDAVGKPFEMSKGIRKTTVICVRTYGRYLQLGKASNLRLGSLKVRYTNHE